MTYSLRPEDHKLIDAALRLGDWILAQRVSRSQRKAIETLQNALRCLPAAPDGLIAEYGFEARFGDEAGKGLYRAWRVGISPAGLEIFSVYTPDEKIELQEKLAHELNFWLRPDVGESTHDGFYVDDWIAEVSDPTTIRATASFFSVIATHD